MMHHGVASSAGSALLPDPNNDTLLLVIITTSMGAVLITVILALFAVVFIRFRNTVDNELSNMRWMILQLDDKDERESQAYADGILASESVQQQQPQYSDKLIDV